MYKNIIILLITIFGATGCAGKTSEEMYADGVKLMMNGKSDSAIIFFKNALVKNQSYLDARYQLARAYMSERKYELAEKEFQKVQLMNPYEPNIKHDLATVNNYLEKQGHAVRTVEE